MATGVPITPDVAAAFAARTGSAICVACPPKPPVEGEIVGGYSEDRYSTIWYPAGRDLGVDSIQPVFGYFGGGGWTFGLVETSNSRVTAESYRAYMKAKQGQTITISQRAKFWEDSPLLVGDGRWVDKYETRALTIGVDIPQFSKLIPTDILAFKHDMLLAVSREGGYSSGDGQIHAMLYNSAKQPIDSATFDGRYTGTYEGDQRLYETSEAYREKYLSSEWLDRAPGRAPNGL